jgi:hypothetical protein
MLISAIALSLALVLNAGPTDAQPHGHGPGFMMGPGMMGPGGFGRLCGPASAGMAEWQADRLQTIVKPDDAQRAKLDELKAASTKAAELMRNACPSEFPKSTVERMKLMENRADAMLQAIKLVRPAMEAFYTSLSDEQRARLDSSSGPGRFWRWRERW